jgi:hypothetical protein
MKEIRSVSFDTSFLLKDDPDVDNIIKELKHDRIDCFVTSTVISELEQLKIWSRIDERTYNKAMSRLKRANSKVIDFKNRFLSSEFGKQCITSMEAHLGAKSKDIKNDCSILIEGLKNGVDLFLSEDFHFTSRLTEEVLDEVTNLACLEYHQMCSEELYSIDTKSFLKMYNKGKIDISFS